MLGNFVKIFWTNILVVTSSIPGGEQEMCVQAMTSKEKKLSL